MHTAAAAAGFVAVLVLVAAVGALTDVSRSISAFLLAIVAIAGVGGLAVTLSMVKAIRDSDVDGMARLEEAARTDSLTGLGNHRAFQEDLANELEIKDPRRHPVSLVMLDMDGLKRANDTLGHKAGDDMIRQLASVLGDTMRFVDRAYRIGGDEFAVILLQEPTWGAFGFAQRLQANLRALNSVVRVSASAGIAEAREQSSEELIRHADLALIAAKRGRRGALIYSDDLDPTHRGGQVEEHVDRRAEALAVIAGALGRTADELNGVEPGHSERVAERAALIARALGFEPQRLSRIRLAGLMHDLGAVGCLAGLCPTFGQQLVTHAGFPDEAPWIGALANGDGELGLEATILQIADEEEALITSGVLPAHALAALRLEHAGANAVICLDALARASVHTEAGTLH